MRLTTDTMRLTSNTRDFGSFLEDIDKDTISTYVNSWKETESKNNYGLFKRVSIDIDEIIKDCVFFYLFDMLSGRDRVSYVRDILCKSGVNLEELKQKVLNTDHKEKGSYFKNFYNKAEDLFYEDVASSVSELVKGNKYIVKTILDMGADDNKDSVEIGKAYIDFYNLNKDFVKKTYEEFCNDTDNTSVVNIEDVSGVDTYKLKEFHIILAAIQSYIIKHTKNSVKDSETRGSLEKVSYLILMILYNADASENKKNPLLSFIDSMVAIVKKIKVYDVFRGISRGIDEKTPWYDGEIFDSIYTKRCIDRWTDSMVEYINEMPNREDVSSSIVVSNNALVTELSGIHLPINNDSKVTVLRDFVYSFYVKEYYRYWVLEVNNRESISKLDLNKYMPERNLEDDFHSLLASYSALNIADWSKELYKAFVENSEMFKEVSTFEYSDEVKAWDEVASLREELSRVRRELEGSNERYLKLLNDVSNKKGSRDSIQVINEYKKELSIKDDEIKRLQDMVDSQQEFLDLIDMEDEEIEKTEEDENDLSILQSKSFVFVSRNNAINDAIKRVLPNSKFADSFTHKSSQTTYDGVILIIGSISHPLYYKWLNYFKGTSTPVYAYTGGNAGKLLNYLKADVMGRRDCFEVGSKCKRLN